MPQNARFMDLWVGICNCKKPKPKHKKKPTAGLLVTFSGNRVVNSMGQTRFTDIGITTHHPLHMGVIVTSSPNHYTNALGTARVTDLVVGCVLGTIVLGSPNHMTN